jgi:hypothetical protein
MGSEGYAVCETWTYPLVDGGIKTSCSPRASSWETCTLHLLYQRRKREAVI